MNVDRSIYGWMDQVTFARVWRTGKFAFGKTIPVVHTLRRHASVCSFKQRYRTQAAEHARGEHSKHGNELSLTWSRRDEQA